MQGLAKVNEDWVPLQTKVFSRWVSNQLKDYPNTHVNDIQKDLSNGVALVELATVLTHKKSSRSWSQSPKLKIEMVQNCDLAIDMFAKDGINFVGISGKDISDNNQKLILGLIWTLILNYSVGQSISSDIIEKQTISNNKSNKINKKSQSSNSAKNALLSWANERIEHYPNIHNFAPFDLSICALLDSYFPNKINYYSLNPNDSEHNSELAIKVMNEVGIPIYVYPDELKRTSNVVDEKTLLTQLSSAKAILDNVKISDEKKESESEDDEKDKDKDEEINRLKATIFEMQAEMLTLKDAREIAEKETNKVTCQLEKTKLLVEDERSKRMKLQSIIDTQILENQKAHQFNKQLSRAIFKLHIQFSIISAQNHEYDDEIQRLRGAWDMAQIELENERELRQDAEFELENLKASIIKEAKNVLKTEQEVRIPSLMNTIGEIKCQIDNRINSIEERVENAQANINSLKNKDLSCNSDDSSEVERLRYAWDMAQNELENEKCANQDSQFQLENLERSISLKAAKLIQAGNQYRMKSFMASFGKVEHQLNLKLGEMQLKLENVQKKIQCLEKSIKQLNEDKYNLAMDAVKMADKMAADDRRHQATIDAYSDTIMKIQKELNEEKEEREKADITIDHLMATIKKQGN